MTLAHKIICSRIFLASRVSQNANDKLKGSVILHIKMSNKRFINHISNILFHHIFESFVQSRGMQNLLNWSCVVHVYLYFCMLFVLQKWSWIFNVNYQLVLECLLF